MEPWAGLLIERTTATIADSESILNSAELFSDRLYLPPHRRAYLCHRSRAFDCREREKCFSCSPALLRLCGGNGRLTDCKSPGMYLTNWRWLAIGKDWKSIQVIGKHWKQLIHWSFKSTKLGHSTATLTVSSALNHPPEPRLQIKLDLQLNRNSRNARASDAIQVRSSSIGCITKATHL